jgi:hypothetical protein
MVHKREKVESRFRKHNLQITTPSIIHRHNYPFTMTTNTVNSINTSYFTKVACLVGWMSRNISPNLFHLFNLAEYKLLIKY